METKTAITVESTIDAPIEKVWSFWAEPKHIMQWCNASEEWHVPYAENDLRKDGKFKTTMAAKDGSMSFDFEGVYTNIQPNRAIEYAMSDGREVKILFSAAGNQTRVIETFDPEGQNPVEMQRAGWQAILDNFKRYTEAN
ncbi:MAG TPA: SRPBCC family protein [Ohtaekwangia sp.]|nr:SRPBCC family protein [Ohtaekwangia sp.]